METMFPGVSAKSVEIPMEGGYILRVNFRKYSRDGGHRTNPFHEEQVSMNIFCNYTLSLTLQFIPKQESPMGILTGHSDPPHP